MAADPVTKSENGNASVVDYTAYPPPPGPSEKPIAKLTPVQEAMRKEVLEHFQSESYKIPGVQDGELREEEQFWLSSDCMLRYLRATKWNSAKAAIEKLQGTLKWRREFGVYDLTPDQVEPEAVTGKEIAFGYDTSRRPALYMIPSRQNTEESPRQIQYVVWMLERALDLTGPGVESIVLMINFADRAKNPTFATSKLVLNILQTHYPERLGASLILNVPFLVQAFFKLISPFIDPVTRNKMKFNPKPIEDGLFAADELFKDSGWGGSREFVWDHEKYWAPFVRMCAEVKAGQMARWRKLGACVGCDEWDYKSEMVVDISPASKTEADSAEDAAPKAEDSDMAENQSASRAQDRDQAPEAGGNSEMVASGTAI